MMETAPTAESVLPHLERALANPSIPARAHIAGRQLLERMTSPVRVVVTGHPGSGKSQLLNLLAGERVIPDGSRLPSVELTHGPERKLTVQFADGTRQERPWGDLGALDRDDVTLAHLEAPLPILRTLSLTEVVTGGTAEDERDGVLWAADRADIVLWCSQEFTPAEQWLWSALPERLKDHGFLILTKADALIRTGELASRIAALEDIVAEEFHSLVPVATLQGLNALLADGGPDADALAASGADALSNMLLRHVEQGRRADLDAALMFLSRFGVDQHLRPGPAERPAPVREPAEAAAPPVETVAAETEVTVAADAPPAPEEPQDKTHGAFEQAPELRSALEVLASCGSAAAERGDPETVLERCVDGAQAVADILESRPEEAFHALHETALEVADRLVLIQLEASGEAAADAATLLLQLRRDIALASAA